MGKTEHGAGEILAQSTSGQSGALTVWPRLPIHWHAKAQGSAPLSLLITTAALCIHFLLLLYPTAHTSPRS